MALCRLGTPGRGCSLPTTVRGSQQEALEECEVKMVVGRVTALLAGYLPMGAYALTRAARMPFTCNLTRPAPRRNPCPRPSEILA